MGYRSDRKSSNGRSKLHAVRRRHRRSSKNHAGSSSCLRECVGSEGLQKVRNHIMKALDFGIESGYLVPTDATYRMLRVSSDLLQKRQRRRKTEKTNETAKYRRKGPEDSWNLREKENKEVEPVESSTKKFEERPVQDARRKRKIRRYCRSRSRSVGNRRRSRRRSRRRGSSSENPDELGEDEDDYEPDKNSGKRNNARNERANSGSRSSRSKTQEIDRTDAGRSDDISDISPDEDETDEEGDKKENNATKS